MNKITIGEMFFGEKRELPKESKENKILKIKNRIALLEARQPMKENQTIVKKLKRQLKNLMGE